MHASDTNLEKRKSSTRRDSLKGSESARVATDDDGVARSLPLSTTQDLLNALDTKTSPHRPVSPRGDAKERLRADISPRGGTKGSLSRHGGRKALTASDLYGSLDPESPTPPKAGASDSGELGGSSTSIIPSLLLTPSENPLLAGALNDSTVKDAESGTGDWNMLWDGLSKVEELTNKPAVGSPPAASVVVPAPQSDVTPSPSLNKRGSTVLKKNKISRTSSTKMYSSVYSKKQISAAVKIQKWYRLRRFLSAIETVLFCNKRRRHVLKEIFSTEETYLASLTILHSQFMERLAQFFSETELLNIFLGVKDLMNLHRDFFSQLRHQVPGAGNKEATAVTTNMAQLFLHFVPQFEDAYTKFLTNQDKSRRMMELMCNRNKDLVREMDKITDRNGSQRGRQFFDSLMTAPMQRLPRYQLLLKEYQKGTNQLYHDVREVGDALAAIAQVTLVVNENKRDHDELHMREMLERNSSMEVLETHTFEAISFAAMRNCGQCDKAIWGLSKSGYRCSDCNQCFHPQCMKQISGQRQCPRRKKLDFSTKKLTYLQEVLVIPYTPSLHVAPAPVATNGSGGGLSGGSVGDRSPRVKSLHLKEGNHAAAAAAAASATPNTKRLLSKRVHRSKAVLCFFDDGLGIAHIRSDETGADKFDFMGDLPWAILDDCTAVEEKEHEDEWVFCVRAKFQEWRFALPTKTEQEAIVAKLNEAKKQGSQRKRAMSSASLPQPIIKK